LLFVFLVGSMESRVVHVPLDIVDGNVVVETNGFASIEAFLAFHKSKPLMHSGRIFGTLTHPLCVKS
jgi:hypothetical protein